MRYLLLAWCCIFSNLANAMPPLLDTGGLLREMQQSGLVLLDIQPPEYYRQVHLAGAVNAPFGQWRSRSAEGFEGMLPAIPQLERALGQWGVRATDRVVILSTGLDAADMAAAARVFWTMKVLGHAEVAILNGGLAALAADELAAQQLSNVPVTPQAAIYQAKPDLTLLADAADTRSALQNDQQLVDARSAAEYLGIHVGGEKERPGTLPRAVNLPFDWMTRNGSAQLLPVPSLKALLNGVGVDAAKPQVHFCHSGNRAALTWFVSYALLGNHQARLYDASMLEWAVRNDLPMERRVQF